MTIYMPIRVCSRVKSTIPFGYLHEIYTCHMLQAFFKAFNEYAVLSRKNGICFSWERTENYGDWQEKCRDKLLAVLRSQAQDPGINKYVYIYWNHRPLTHGCFVQLLRDAGFTIIECKTLSEIKAIIDGQQAKHGAILDTV